MKILNWMAPIMGVGNVTFRNIFARFFPGFDYAVSPFIAASKIKKINKSMINELAPENNRNLEIIPQIMGTDPGDFVNLANKLYDLGYSAVNWNIGCPYPGVVRKKRGCGILPYPDMIQSFLDNVIPHLKPDLSIKTRLGLHESNEIFKIIPIFNQYPLYNLIIHTRTGKQMYDGTADRDAFQECAELTKHDLMYNGDIFSYQQYREIIDRFPGLKSVMIGRGILRNPFLINKICGKAMDNYHISYLKEYHDTLYNSYRELLCGEKHVIDKMKEIWGYLSYSFINGEKYFKKIKKVNSLSQYLSIISVIFHKEGRLKQLDEL